MHDIDGSTCDVICNPTVPWITALTQAAVPSSQHASVVLGKPWPNVPSRHLKKSGFHYNHYKYCHYSKRDSEKRKAYPILYNIKCIFIIKHKYIFHYLLILNSCILIYIINTLFSLVLMYIYSIFIIICNIVLLL